MSYPGSHSTQLDRQSNPVAEQGGVYAGARYDVSAKIAIQRENKSVGPSAYSGSENEQVWDVTPQDILFRAEGLASGSGGDVTMSVLPCLNGLGAVATARYGSSANASEIIRQAVKNRISVVGVAFQALEASRGNVERGITVQMGGLKTLPMGNNKFGSDSSADDSVIKPGDLVCADVPVPGREGLTAGPGSHARRGVPMDKYTLQMRRCSPKSSGATLLLHINEILRDPTKWKVAMGEHLAGTKAWASAAHDVMNSYLAGGIFFVRELMAAGLVVPSARGTALAKDQKTLSTAFAPAGVNQELTDNNLQDLGFGADTFAVHLAELLGVISTKSKTDDIDARLGKLGVVGSDARKALRTLRVNALQRIFYSGSNTAFEFGFGKDGNRYTSSARYPRTGAIRPTSEGAMLNVQLNHVRRAVAGFHRAVLDDLRMVLGKSTTGASSYGSGNAHVFLGCARP